MYAVSNKYKEVIYSQDCRHKLRVWFNDVEYEDIDDICEKLTVKSRIIPFGSKIFMLENFISKEAELILHDIDIEDIQDPIRISLGTYIDDDKDYEYVPIGIFNLQDRPTTDKKKTTITLRDNSVKFDFGYNAQPLIEQNGGSATKLEILQDICSQAGVEFDDDFNFDFIGNADQIGIYDNSITGRIYVSYIAGQAGAIPTINRDGKLKFIYINDLTKVEIPIWYVESYKNGDKFKISRVVYESGIIKYERGTDTNDTLFLDASNPYVSSNDQVQSILDIVDGFEINSFSTGKILGNPAIDSYDLIQIDEYDENSANLFDINEETVGQYLLSNGSIKVHQNWATSDFISVTPNGRITYNGLTNVGNAPCSAFYDEEQNFVSSFKQAVGENTITIPENVYYVKFSINHSNHNDNVFIVQEHNVYTTLACNELVYNGVCIQTFDSEIGLEARTENVTLRDDDSNFKNWARTEIDNVKAEVKISTGKVDSLELTTDEQIRNIQEQFDGYTPLNTTVELQRSVTQIQNDSYTRTQIDTMLTDGTVSMLKSTLVTVDADGTTWDKNDSNVKTNVDADGLEIIDKTGATNEVLLEAKYDSTIGETVVRAKRIIVEKYLVVGTHSRFEDYQTGTGCFYLA